MTVEEVEMYLRAVADQPLEGILLFGGEPFLVYDVLQASLPLAASLAPQVYVFTNGSWATDLATARGRLAGLQQAGLDYVLFSVDAFHQAHVPLHRVGIGIAAARALDYGSVEIDNRFLGMPEMDNAFNRHTLSDMARLRELCDLTGVTVHGGPARMVGRAADELSHLIPVEEAAADHCPLPDYLGGNLRAPTGVEIHPDGWVNLCAGLALGHAAERPIDRILADFDADAHPIIRELAAEGPAGLLRLAARYGFSAATRYVDGCHLCYEARRFLRPYYPDYLAPAHAYLPG
jgi:MoaA/NifB/PqqE/SkfB family radical SAM enzyme